MNTCSHGSVSAYESGKECDSVGPVHDNTDSSSKSVDCATTDESFIR